MADSNLMRMESALRKQQQALTELIDIALHAVHESGDSSVAAMHLQRRLQALADSLKPVLRDTTTAGQVSSTGTTRAF
jgi:hypothetical protein